MTNQERAEKIRFEITHCERTGYPCDCEKFITSQLDEAGREAVTLAAKGKFRSWLKEFINTTYAEGFASARLKAAGIAEKHSHGDSIFDGRTAGIIAERIRGMEPPK